MANGKLPFPGLTGPAVNPQKQEEIKRYLKRHYAGLYAVTKHLPEMRKQRLGTEGNRRSEQKLQSTGR